MRDAGDARLELEDAADGEPDTPAAVGGAPVRRWPAALPWAIAGASLLFAATAFVKSRPGAAGNRPAMRFSAVTNLSGVEAQPSLSPDGRSVAYVSNRGNQWDVYVGLVTGGRPVRITNDPNLETRPRWSRDGSRLLFARLNEAGLFDIWEAPALGGAARRIVLNGVHPTWSADGRSIAYSSGGVLWICDASGANARAVTGREAPVAHYQPAFSHDGSLLAFVRRREGPYGELAVANVATGAVRDVTRDDALAMSPVWSPDDRFIYFASSRGGTVNVWKTPAESGEPQQVTAGQGEDADIDLSADGTRLVFSSYHVNVNLAQMGLEPAASRLRWLTTDSARGETGPRYSPDGRRIAYWSTRAGAERESVWVMDADGGNPSLLVESDRVNVHPRWTPDGQHLVYVSRTRGRGLTMDESELRRIPVAGGPPQTLPITRLLAGAWGDVAPDGRVLYRVSPDAAELYDPRQSQSQTVEDLRGAPLWSRDGRSFAYATRPESREPAAGLWTGTLQGPRRLIFAGWVVAFAWTGTDDLLVVEGKPDLKGVLWRLDGSGRRSRVLSDLPLFFQSRNDAVILFRFDVHPDGRYIAFEALESFEADIGLIDSVL
jgi:Tol biopolymer transport system component